MQFLSVVCQNTLRWKEFLTECRESYLVNLLMGLNNMLWLKQPFVDIYDLDMVRNQNDFDIPALEKV